MVSAEFTAAAAKVKTLAKSPDNDTLLELYALYKTATEGELDVVKNARPGMFDPKGRAKWDAYSAKKGLSQADAEKQYIALVEKLSA
ncbi:hypothetical protein EMPS_05049 [Entomortierella parvispora]|uniref:ACB domain-containing protein n=1 Tax=Entomortierella parvispora TaxID=205924 RepID=A0A9P3H9R7_9FUNG|nr:hypothetical protein EMPS_05049 [Entomortierella parvispora]